MPIRLVNTNRPSIDKDSLDNRTLGTAHKPYRAGIWYGLGDEWLDWAAKHLPEILRSHIFEIKVNESRILKLATVDDCLACTVRYGQSKKPPYTGYDIDWDKVAKDWAGVEITRECLSEYMSRASQTEIPELIWLEGWDVGQGCIWDGSVIRSSKKIPTTDPRLKQAQRQSPPERI